MQNIFIGTVFEDEREQQLIKDSPKGISVASKQYQWGFLQGLADPDTQIFSALMVGAFPIRSPRFRFGAEDSVTELGKIHYLPFWNIPVLRDISRCNKLKKSVSEIIKQNDNVTVYFYGLYNPFLKVLRYIKKKYGSRAKCCLIIPDLPGKYGIMRNSHSLAGIKDRLELKTKFTLPKYADCYVVLTEPAQQIYHEKPSVVIEGFLPPIQFQKSVRQPKTVLYTGSFAPELGIEDLLKAFEQIEDPDYRLWLCGAGGIQKTVEEYAAKDSRITYYGYLSKEKICELQSKCDVLINPRHPEGEYTKYSFPSKTMEYLLSGSKVLMYRLPGIGAEYYDYIYTIDGSDVQSLKEAIKQTCSDEKFYDEKSQRQIDWITQNKSVAGQVAKVKDL